MNTTSMAVTTTGSALSGPAVTYFPLPPEPPRERLERFANIAANYAAAHFDIGEWDVASAFAELANEFARAATGMSHGRP